MADDIKDARTAAVKFVNALDRAADVTLVDFDTQVRVARFGRTTTRVSSSASAARKPDGWTALYDAIGVYLNGAQSQDGQKVLVLYTDGGDTTQLLTFHDMLDLLQGVRRHGLRHRLHGAPGQRRLQQRMRARAGGGRDRRPGVLPGVAKDLDGVFEKIRPSSTRGIHLGYSSTDTRTDGAWRRREIKLLRPDLKGVKLRTRAGYFAPYKAKPLDGPISQRPRDRWDPFRAPRSRRPMSPSRARASRGTIFCLHGVQVRPLQSCHRLRAARRPVARASTSSSRA